MTIFTLLSTLWKNPLIQKDLRTRMRDKKAFILVSLHLILLGLATGAVYWIFHSSLSSSGNLQERHYFGKAIFGLVIWLEIVMVSFVAPALTSGSISSERERLTYDLLQVTLISPRQIVLGKYLPGLIFLLLLIMTSLPMQAPAFLMGGVVWQEILLATIILVVSTITFSALGMLLSCLIRSTRLAMTLAYSLTILSVFGVPVLGVLSLFIFGVGFPNGISSLPRGSVGLLVAAVWTILSLTPLGTMVITDFLFIDQGSLLIGEISLNAATSFQVLSPWIVYVVLYLLASGGMIWLCVRLVGRVDIE